MKNFLLFVVLIIAFAACKNVKNSREEILQLSSDYDSAIENIRNTYRGLSGELEIYSMYKSRISEARDEETARMNIGEGAPVGKLAELQSSFSDYNGRFSKLAQEIGNYANEMNAYKPQLEAMKNELNGGSKFKGNLKESMTGFRKAIDDANAKIKVWEAQVAELNKEIEMKYNEIAPLQGLPLVQ